MTWLISNRIIKMKKTTLLSSLAISTVTAADKPSWETSSKYIAYKWTPDAKKFTGKFEFSWIKDVCLDKDKSINGIPSTESDRSFAKSTKTPSKPKCWINMNPLQTLVNGAVTSDVKKAL